MYFPNVYTSKEEKVKVNELMKLEKEQQIDISKNKK